MRVFKKEALLLTTLAVLLTAGPGIPSALSYFTTYTAARGEYPIFLNRQTEIREEVSDWTKHVVIENTGEADCFIRLRAFCGSQYTLVFTAGEGWNQTQDGWWYYPAVLAPGQQTAQLQIAITGVPSGESDPRDFQVVVVQEHTAVLYTPEGIAYPDWNLSANLPPKRE